MNPDVVEAMARFRREGILAEAPARPLETVAVVAAFAPEVAPGHPREPGGFEPGGVRYGVGGAGGEF